MSSDNQEKSQREKKDRKKAEELLKITEEAERKARYQKEQKQREDKERKKAADLLNKFENRFNEKKEHRKRNSYPKTESKTNTKQNSHKKSSIDNESSNMFVNIFGKIGESKGLGEFSFGKFFGGFNRKFSEEELVKTLFVGTPSTTPSIDEVSINYPEPWLCYKLTLTTIIIFYGFVFLFNQSQNPNVIPAIIFTGSFAVPISTLVLFFELNIRRNVPFWVVVKLILSGAILSFLIAEILASNTSSIYSSTGAWFASLIEEPAKLLALIILTLGKKKYPYILNGLLLGAAVGCGFAAFESSGYALRGAAIKDADYMINIIQLRGILAPFMHIVWTSVAGAALWRVKKDNSFSFNHLQNRKFYMPFILMIICHALWNSPIQLPLMGTFVICGLIAWIVALSLVNLGIEQISEEKSGKKVFKNI